MEEPRPPAEAEVPSLIGFLDKHLRPGQPWSITAEYPQVFNPQNRPNIRMLKEQDRIVSHAVTKYLMIRNTLGLFKVAAIGSVLTDPEFRNQGHSLKVMQSCLEAAHQEGADFAILWTDLYDFYRKLGFELAGSEVSVVIENPLPIPAVPELRVLETEKVSPDAILKLYSKHTCGSLRTAEDIRRCLAIPNSRVYTLWNSNNEILAYAVEGKGADLHGYVHEWGGDVPQLIYLLGHIRQKLGKSLTLITPRHSENLIRELKKFGVMTHEGYLGMIRPINTENLFFKIRRRARQLGLNNFVIEQNGTEYTVGFVNDTITLKSPAELTRLLFGPLPDNSLRPELQQLFPVPMWVWGWDSV